MSDAADLLHALQDPACFPAATGPVTVLQTHISIVCLCGDRVCKFKKPIRLPFLDFSTLAARRHWCREEVRLNRRLCPDVYLGTAALRRTAAGLRLGPIGDDDGADVVDVAVVMARLPQERMLDRLLAENAVTPADIDDLARRVAAFHATADRGPAVRAAGSPERLADLIRGNFRELQALQAHGLPGPLLAALGQSAEDDLRFLLPRLHRRAEQGRIVDGHGDLHARNICLTNPPSIYDCLEFAPDFRCGDVATEIAFLGMDLRYRGAHALATRFVQAYVTATGDAGLPELLPPLIRYRALVRAKVAVLAASEPELPAADRDGARHSALAHLALAAATAIETRGAAWFVLCGPPGSGKSALATHLQRWCGWPGFATDAIRKQLAGLPPTTRAPATCYTAAFSQQTYDELFVRATAATKAGASVVLLDGNFATPETRTAAAAAASAAGATATILFVDVPDAVGRTRVATRATGERISDAGPAEYAALRARFVPPVATPVLPMLSVSGIGAPETVAANCLAQMLVAASPRP